MPDRKETSDPVAALLLDALDQEVRRGPVDVTLLAGGASARLRRRQRIRRVRVVAVALTTVTGVAMLSLLGPAWPGSTVSTIADRGLADRTSRPTSTSVATDPVDPVSLPVRYAIPDLTRALAVLPPDKTLSGGSEQRRQESALSGPVACLQDWSAPSPSIAGRSFQWFAGTTPEHVADLSVTGWPEGTGRVIFDEAVAGDLQCRVTGELSRQDVTVAGADQSWVVTSDLGPSAGVVGAARVGDLIVSAALRAPTVSEAAARTDELVTLLDAAVTDLRASDLAAVRSQGEG
ncbi:hypothetical protein ACFFKU_13755 [Kineococcus gynurae]|uniref:PknH-like protein n=1 Tax=Kineococcus gynurae TaxID=452979 RepID=A0ABV5LU69_9ACTN